jgi:UDP-N-acetylglucosamine 2-epimerase (non-hydrolysing)
VPAERITRVGNIMLDSFEHCRPAIEAARSPEALGLAGRPYCVATLHRPANVDAPAPLRRLVAALVAVQRRLPIVFPVHPRTAARLAEFGLAAELEAAGVRLIEPLPYIRFMSLVAGAAAVVTDSGGLQEETTYLSIPCFTMRENTERPITIEEGTNRLATPASLPTLLAAALEADRTRLPRPEYWDGRTAARCLSDLRRRSVGAERPARRAAA